MAAIEESWLLACSYFSRRARAECQLRKALKAASPELLDALLNCRKALAESSKLEKELRAQVEISCERAASIERRLKGDKGTTLKQEAKEQRQRLALLEKQFSEQKKKTDSLTRDLNSLESTVRPLIFKYSFDSQTQKIDRLLAKMDSNPAARILEKIELEIIEREVQAAKGAEVIARESPPAQLSAEAIQAIDSLVTKVTSVGRIFDSLGAMVIAADPSIERAYQRLCEQLNRARDLGVKSSLHEKGMEEELAEYSAEAQLWQKRAEARAEGGNEELLKRARHNFTLRDSAMKELSAAIKDHRFRNFMIDDRLFRIQGIVDRLFLIKLLLSALPGQQEDKFEQFKSLVEATSNLLKQPWQNLEEAAQNNVPIDFLQRIQSLENRTLRAYLLIAKGEAEALRAIAAAHFKKEVSEVTSILESERNRLTLELENWSSLAEKALAAKKDFVYTVASQRREQLAGIIKTTEQSLEVLSITVTRSLES